MLPEHLHWIWAQFEPGDGEPWSLQTIARQLVAEGNLHAAATVYDRAFGLDPTITEIRRERAELLDRLAVVEHGLVFRYIPAGAFLMGNPEGEPDEQPWHPVWLSHYWLTEVPLSWADYCRLRDWFPPPRAEPRVEDPDVPNDLGIFGANKIRRLYCTDRTDGASRATSAVEEENAAELWSRAFDGDPDTPFIFHTKPLIAIGWDDALKLCEQLSASVVYTLPTEAQWEKAARGGVIGARHAWGNEPPTHDRCDFDRFKEFSILPSRTFAPNDYGLYAMIGGVWEWTRDWYDRDYYHEAPANDPPGPAQGKEKVLRGGCWTDCAEVITVTFRHSREVNLRPDGRGYCGGGTPNIGIRLCREMKAPVTNDK